MTNETKPSVDPLDAGNFSGNLDPALNPAGFAEGEPLPTPGTEEYKAAQKQLRGFLGEEIRGLSEEINGKSYDELTADQRARAERARLLMTPVEGKNGRRGYRNDLYSDHPLSEGKPAYLEATFNADNVYTIGHKVHSERLAAQDAVKAKQRTAEEDFLRQKQVTAQLEVEKAHAAAEKERADAAAAAAAAARPPLTPAERRANSTKTLNSLIKSLDEFNYNSLQASGQDLRADLSEEDIHRLELHTKAWMQDHPEANDNRAAVGILHGRIQQWNNTPSIREEKRTMNTPDEPRRNRFRHIDVEFEEQREALKAWDEAHAINYTMAETPGIQALDEYMAQAIHDRLHDSEPKRKVRVQEQSELLHKIEKDSRALQAFLDTDLPANKHIRQIAEGYIAQNERDMSTFERDLRRNAPVETGRIEHALEPNELPGPRTHRGTAAFRDVVNKSVSKDRRTVYNELFANKHHRQIHTPTPGDHLPMTEGRRKVIEYFESPNQGDTLTDNKGGLSDRFVKYAQRNALAREVKGDRAAEIELRNRGVVTRKGFRGREIGGVRKGLRRVVNTAKKALPGNR